MDEKLLWMEALAGVDMGLTLGDMNVCVNLQTALLDWCGGDEADGLAAAWRATYGMVPPLIHEILNVRGKTSASKEQVTELALVIARVRVTFLALARDTVHREQVRALAAERAVSDYPEYRQKSYVRTHAKLCEGGVCREVAAGVAYCMHTPSMHAHWTNAPALRAETPTSTLEIQADAIPGDADHLALPQIYLGVDIQGMLVLLDAYRGASTVKVANAVPHGWCVRVSGHTNVFLAGDAGAALRVTLNEGRSSAMDVPVALPRYPTSGAHAVENKWVVWRGGNGKARALEWDGANARLCSDEEARLHASATVILKARGNRVWAGETCVATLPTSESITVVAGTAFAFDAFTQGGDWWRVDVRANKAWVVGVPGVNIICTIAPVVEWNI